VDLQDHIRFLRQEVAQLREWIDRHVSDYSAVHLLCNVTVLERSGALQLAENGGGSLAEELREHALSLVISYPSHEALWLYLRHFLSLSTPQDIREFTKRLRSYDKIPLNVIQKYILNLL
jgi:protein prenyltransferase alpha subunit repeat containing protein 1